MISPISRQLNAGQPVNTTHPQNIRRMFWWEVSPAGNPSYRGGRRWMDLCRNSHGILSGSVTWSGSAPPGGLGSILHDGTTGTVALIPQAHPFLQGTGSRSLGVWIKCGTTTTPFPVIVGMGLGPSQQGWGFVQAPTSSINSIYCQQIDSTGSSSAGGAANQFMDNRWHRLWMVTDRGAATIYLYGDGKPVASGAMPAGTLTASTAFRTAARDTVYWSGNLNGVTCYDIAVTAKHIADDWDLSRRNYPGVLNRAARRLTVVMTTAGNAFDIFQSPVIQSA